MPEMTPVKSSLIKAIGYNDEKEELHVEFKNGSEYLYQGVPQGTYEALANANSVGAFFAANIKNTFEFAKVR
jgi:hypothetical protein